MDAPLGTPNFGLDSNQISRKIILQCERAIIRNHPAKKIKRKYFKDGIAYSEVDIRLREGQKILIGLLLSERSSPKVETLRLDWSGVKEKYIIRNALFPPLVNLKEAFLYFNGVKLTQNILNYLQELLEVKTLHADTLYFEIKESNSEMYRFNGIFASLEVLKRLRQLTLDLSLNRLVNPNDNSQNIIKTLADSLSRLKSLQKLTLNFVDCKLTDNSLKKLIPRIKFLENSAMEHLEICLNNNELTDQFIEDLQLHLSSISENKEKLKSKYLKLSLCETSIQEKSVIDLCDKITYCCVEVGKKVFGKKKEDLSPEMKIKDHSDDSKEENKSGTENQSGTTYSTASASVASRSSTTRISNFRPSDLPYYKNDLNTAPCKKTSPKEVIVVTRAPPVNPHLNVCNNRKENNWWVGFHPLSSAILENY